MSSSTTQLITMEPIFKHKKVLDIFIFPTFLKNNNDHTGFQWLSIHYYCDSRMNYERQLCVIIKSMASGARLHGFETLLCELLTV